MSIKLASLSDAKEICRVQRCSWQHVYPKQLISDMFQALPFELHQQLWKQRLSSEKNQIWVLKTNGVQGFLMLEKQTPEIELAALYLQPDTIGKGWGRALLEKACQSAAMKEVYCWVMQDNQQAEGFYRHTGFQFSGEQRQVEFAGSYFVQKKAYLAADQRFF
ncbi:GNAT family N-acetyltransferase [Agarivorans sp. Alg241-V36]|uniref:GNAT family N-acetyltransferase n=1 Tax=Agarivorans sp. Alg241-V36 TaxID=2305992 RepID=UPI0013D8BDD5|nr:GNAT family N-acetyltransferase [Agarivorans sp. Alg241-V36]